MEGASLLCDGFEQLQDPGVSMAIEVVDGYEQVEEMLFGGGCRALASQVRQVRFERLLER